MRSVEAPPKTAERIAELDGLRGIAILLVLIAHFGSPAVLPGLLKDGLAIGWAGVDLFFVLSGFLISGILMDSAGSPVYFRRFYLRRVFRIFPVYYAYLILYFYVVPPIASVAGHVAFGGVGTQGATWYWTYLSNWRLDPHHYLRHFWSLSLEEQFYLAWPLLVSATSRRSLKYISIFLVLLSPGLRLLGVHYGIPTVYLYQTTPFRLEGLALGALIAIAWREPVLWLKLKKALRFTWLPALMGLGFAIAHGGTSPLSESMQLYGYTSVALSCSALVFGVVDVWGTSTLLARSMRTAWLLKLGKYSYGIYVWHFPISALVHPLTEAARLRLPDSLGWILLPVALTAGISISYLIALLSWKVLEKPLLAWKERITGSTQVVLKRDPANFLREESSMDLLR